MRCDDAENMLLSLNLSHTNSSRFMSYLALARTWRPKSFSDVIGQQHVLKALSNALSLGRVHHAYLFSGTRGVGKTSIARLFAKGLNCETGVTATPCGKCQSCLDIEQNRCIDLIEIDAASRTKVEDTREILDNVQYLPVRSRYKIYLIDEVHMLSRSSFNALLKTLEEPPEHVKFLLATTDPQKLPITVLSRCLQFHLRALSDEQIQQQLTHILKKEQIKFDEKALQLLAKAAEGSMRDALSLTEQAIASGNECVDVECVSQMLGLLDDNYALTLVEMVSQGDSQGVMDTINHIASLGVDWDMVLSETLSLLHHIAMLQLLPKNAETKQESSRLHALAKQITPEDVQLYYQILVMARKDLIYTPNRRMGVEMAFLRLLVFQPSETVELPVKTAQNRSPEPLQNVVKEAPQTEIKTPISEPETRKPAETAPSQVASPLTARLLKAREQITQEETFVKKSKSASETAAPVRAKTKQNVLEKWIKTTEKKEKSTHETETAKPAAESDYRWQFSTMDAPTYENSAITPKILKKALEEDKTPELTKKLIDEACQLDDWSALVEQLNVPRLIKLLALNAFKEAIDDNQFRLHIRSSQRHLNTDDAQKLLSEAVSTHLNKTVTITFIEDDDQAMRTPIEWRNWLYEKKCQDARADVLADPMIDKICRYFDAKIDEESIRPV